ncbi:S41 family peptidase [Amycolatopsis umgeniensis]|uniref:C-terminal processing protease CtpA/Prc n=1 Tax=Amycolatopsis umgeniensis TaxID=336628 RepID=A0A841B651_9PSEU|nr:S41 family peptidase [Amycolatopsis umgeniensis]MBB5854275.1 C-terminal processing protease CtpA/Prc [Amycolatopsis umgeniensis]
MDERARIDDVCRRLRDHYVFPDVAEKLTVFLRARLSDGAYAGLDDQAFSVAVTEDLQSVNGDKHLRLRHHIDPLPEVDGQSFDPEEFRREAELNCHGIASARRLAGNVGYLETKLFYGPDIAGEALAAAMTLLATTDALLIDVRENRGGSPAAVALLISYLVDEPVHFNSIYLRDGDVTNQFWTLPYVPGRKFGADKPVWVLTGPTTFSGAEDLSYSLQQLDRAKTVGAVTGGGANPRQQYKVDTHLDITVPGGRSVNPVTGTNWEGVGVQPDVAVAVEDAFDTAYAFALDHVLTLGDSGVRRPIADEARLALAGLG